MVAVKISHYLMNIQSSTVNFSVAQLMMENRSMPIHKPLIAVANLSKQALAILIDI
jgi:hypothetical protein